MAITHTKAATMAPTTVFSAHSVMQSFVALYYQVSECMPNRLSEMYGENSTLSHGPISAVGSRNIAAISCNLPLSGKHVKILSMDIQDTGCGFVILMQAVLDNKIFSQVFVLEYEEGSHHNHFVCRNDIFRFLPEYNVLPIQAQDLVPLSKFMSLYPGGDEPLVAIDSEYEMPPTSRTESVVINHSEEFCPPEYVPITYGPFSRRKSDIAKTSGVGTDQESDPQMIRAVSTVVGEKNDGDSGSHSTALAATSPNTLEEALDSQSSIPLSDVTIENEESSKSIGTKTDRYPVSSTPLEDVSHVQMPVQSHRVVEHVVCTQTSATPDSALSKAAGKLSKRGPSAAKGQDNNTKPSRGKRRSHPDRKRSGRVSRPTAVVRLRALRKPLDIKELIGNLRNEFSDYGYAVKRVDVKMRMGLAFVEYEGADGVDAAVAAWNSGPRKTGKFAGVNLNVFAKKH